MFLQIRYIFYKSKFQTHQPHNKEMFDAINSGSLEWFRRGQSDMQEVIMTTDWHHNVGVPAATKDRGVRW